MDANSEVAWKERGRKITPLPTCERLLILLFCCYLKGFQYDNVITLKRELDGGNNNQLQEHAGCQKLLHLLKVISANLSDCPIPFLLIVCL